METIKFPHISYSSDRFCCKVDDFIGISYPISHYDAWNSANDVAANYVKVV
jgi:hypothetical protein